MHFEVLHVVPDVIHATLDTESESPDIGRVVQYSVSSSQDCNLSTCPT